MSAPLSAIGFVGHRPIIPAGDHTAGLVVKWWPGFFPNHSLLRLSQVSKFAVDPLARALPDELFGTLLIEETFNPLGPAIRLGDVDDPADEEQPEREEIQRTRPGFAVIEAMRPHETENPQQIAYHFAVSVCVCH